MPIFEFTCNQCSRRFSVLVGMVANPKPIACPRCGSADAARCVSRFARMRSEDERLDRLSDESAYGDIENDPKAMRQWVRDMGSAMDEDMGDDLEEALEQDLSGEPADSAPADGIGQGD